MLVSGRVEVLPDWEMTQLGFTDHREGHWYLCRRVASSTTLNITIEKETGNWEEYVLDEWFGQPAPYMTAKPEFRDEVVSNVDKLVLELQNAGLDVHVDHAAYGG